MAVGRIKGYLATIALLISAVCAAQLAAGLAWCGAVGNNGPPNFGLSAQQVANSAPRTQRHLFDSTGRLTLPDAFKSQEQRRKDFVGYTAEKSLSTGFLRNSRNILMELVPTEAQHWFYMRPPNAYIDAVYAVGGEGGDNDKLQKIIADDITARLEVVPWVTVENLGQKIAVPRSSVNLALLSEDSCTRLGDRLDEGLKAISQSLTDDGKAFIIATKKDEEILEAYGYGRLVVGWRDSFKAFDLELVSARRADDIGITVAYLTKVRGAGALKKAPVAARRAPAKAPAKGAKTGKSSGRGAGRGGGREGERDRSGSRR